MDKVETLEAEGYYYKNKSKYCFIYIIPALLFILFLVLTIIEAQKIVNIKTSNGILIEKQTLLDAIHEHTKRMNYFIKFSKPFIQTTYANSEVNQQLMCVILNYFFSNMEVYEKNKFYKNLDLFKILPKNFEEEKYKLKHDYLNEIE